MPIRTPEDARRAQHPVSRRRILKTLSVLGLGPAVLGRALATLAEEQGIITEEMIRKAEWISGVELTDEKRALMLNGLNEAHTAYETMRAVEIDNSVAPALLYRTAAPVGSQSHGRAESGQEASRPRAENRARVERPSSPDALALLGVAELGELLRRGETTAVELTEIYIERLRRLDPTLRCVITLTPDRALQVAQRADAELAAGVDRGPLHGIPWGAKDLIAVPGYRTTWGATPYAEQKLGETATVVQKLDAAGAVLVAKLSVGALAWGDVWFGGTTRNPWNPEQGSSGSSAGSASATAAGLVGFALGTETWGSIVSPCTRCGATGLRPTFGTVSRYGVMALAWSMDKIGPIARSAEDCGLIFDGIRGADARDRASVDGPFEPHVELDPTKIRIGYIESLFDIDRAAEIEAENEDETPEGKAEIETRRQSAREWADHDRRTLEVLRSLGYQLVPIELPASYPVDALQIILTAEAGAAFDQLTRSGRDSELVRQSEYAWPNVFRQAQMIPAVEYLRANRIRSLVMTELEELMRDIDLFVAPSFLGSHLLLTNLTGHPALVMPNGFRSADGTPTSITLTGRLFGESELLAVGRSYQHATRFHAQHPTL